MACCSLLALTGRRAVAEECRVFGRISSYSVSLFEVVKANIDAVLAEADRRKSDVDLGKRKLSEFSSRKLENSTMVIEGAGTSEPLGGFTDGTQ